MDYILIKSVNEGDLFRVKDVLSRGANVNYTDSDKWTALHYASDKGDTDIVDVLLNYEAEINVLTKERYSPVMLAAKKGHKDVVSVLTNKGANLEIVNAEGWTALHYASYKGHTDIVKVFVNNGADINVATKMQEPSSSDPPISYSPVFYSPVFYSYESISYPISYPSSSYEWQLAGSTAVIIATKMGYKDVVLILTKKGANLDIVNAEGWAALHYASYEGHTDIVEVLVTHGADINVITKEATPVTLAAKKRYQDLFSILTQEKANKVGSTPVLLAAKKGHKDIVSILTQRGANLDLLNKNQMTALHCSSREGHSEIVQLFLHYHADPNICNKDGNTALHIASKEGHINVIQSLLSQGADMTIKNNEGNTPLDECCDKRKDEVSRVFKEYNPKRVLEDVSIWNIEYLNEEQVFEKPEYGIKIVIPPSSVEVGQEVKTEVNVVTLKESDIILPPDVELVSCFYKIKTTGKFSKPIKLHLQHNVQLRSQEESQLLAFIRAKGQPPYKFELLPAKYDQVFTPYDNSGVIAISDFCIIGIIDKIKSVLFQQPPYRYAMTVFFKEKAKFCWEIQAVVTKNLGPLIESVKAEKQFENWKRIYTFAFSDPDITEVTTANENYDIQPILSPYQLSRKFINQFQPGSALPSLTFKVSLKDKKELTDLKLTIRGIRLQMTLTIFSYNLRQEQETTTHFTNTPSTNSHPSIHIPSSYDGLGISDELLCKEPKIQHLMTQLNDIRCDWEIIGVQLAVNDVHLKSIKQNWPHNDTAKLLEVLRVWKDQRTCEISWRKIITVVEDPPVQNKAVAEKIFYYLLRPEIKNDYSYQPGQEITTFNSPPPIYQEPIKTKGKDGSWFMLLLVAIFVAVIAYLIYITRK